MLRYILRALTLWLVKRLRVGYVGPSVFCVPGDHIGDAIFVDGLYERELLESTFDKLLVSRVGTFKKSVCLDIGANIGNHSIFLSERFQRVISFEPNPAFCMAFKATMLLNRVKNVTLVEAGLGDKTGRVAYVQANKQNLGSSHFSLDVSLTSDDVMILDVEVGDEVVSSLTSDPVSLVKIDVEGFELAVINGLEKTIREQLPVILFEIHPEVDEKEALHVIRRLKSLGYQHLYTCEYERGSHSSRLVRGIARLFNGVGNKPRKVTAIKKCEYRMLVALESPL